MINYMRFRQASTIDMFRFLDNGTNRSIEVFRYFLEGIRDSERLYCIPYEQTVAAEVLSQHSLILE